MCSLIRDITVVGVLVIMMIVVYLNTIVELLTVHVTVLILAVCLHTSFKTFILR